MIFFGEGGSVAAKKGPVAPGDRTLKPTLVYRLKNPRIFKDKTNRMLPVSEILIQIPGLLKQFIITGNFLIFFFLQQLN